MKDVRIIGDAVSDLFEAYYRSFFRYPLAIVGSLLITLGLIGLNEEWWAHLFEPEKDYFWPGVILTGLTVFPLGISSSVLSKHRGRTLLWYSLAFILSIGAYLWFSGTSWGYAEAGWIKLPPLILVWLSGLLIPFLVLPEGNGNFIPYARSLFLRVVLSFAFTMALYAGLSLAIASVQLLFDISLDNEIYLNLFLVCIGMVFPGQLLTGLPWDSVDEQVRSGFPNVGFYLSRYLLIPFTTGYLLILYAYFLRQIIRREWPQGWIGPLSIGLSALALFTRYFTTQMGDRIWNPFEKTVIRIIFPALIPVGIAIVLAILERVGFYGWTEGRWAGVLVGSWIAGVGAFYTLKPDADLRNALYVLMVIILINWVGPLSGSARALNDQARHLGSWETAHWNDEQADEPWDALNPDELVELEELLAFFAAREYWDKLDEQSRYWRAYRQYRGKEEPPKDTWRAFLVQFKGRSPERAELDWACEDKIWITPSDLENAGSKLSFFNLERGRNRFQDWELNWRFPPVLRYLPEGRDADIDLGPEIRSWLEGQALYRRYSSDSMPCFEYWKNDQGIRICFSQLSGHLEKRDTVLYGAGAWVTIMGPQKMDN